MSRPKSKLTKILRQSRRMEEKQLVRERAGRIEGESEDAELARKKRDLEGWLGMMKEREVEDAVMKAVDDTAETKENE